MKALWFFFFVSIRRYLRTIVAPLLMQVIGPLLMIVILGTALHQQLSVESKFEQVRLAVVNEDHEGQSQQLLDFLSGGEMVKLLDIGSFDNMNEAKQAVSAEQYDALLQIESGYTERFAAGDSGGLAVYIDNHNEDAGQIVGGILQSWQDQSAAVRIRQAGGGLSNFVNAAEPAFLLEERSLTANGMVPRAIDYYSVTFVVMTLFFTGVLAGNRVEEDFVKPMLWRLKCVPVRTSFLISGNLLSTIMIGFVQMVVVVLFTKWVFGANWGSRWGIVLCTMFLLVALSHLFFSSLVLSLRDIQAANGIFTTLAQGLPIIAGIYYPNMFGGAFGQFFKTYGTPHSLANTAIFASIYGGSTSTIALCIAILAILVMLFLGITIRFARRRVL